MEDVTFLKKSNQKTLANLGPRWWNRRSPGLMQVFLLLSLQKKNSFLPSLTPS
jgi:hypothetical protein